MADLYHRLLGIIGEPTQTADIMASYRSDFILAQVAAIESDPTVRNRRILLLHRLKTDAPNVGRELVSASGWPLHCHYCRSPIPLGTMGEEHTKFGVTLLYRQCPACAKIQPYAS